MFFADYKLHPGSRIKPTLIWEFDTDTFDFQIMKDLVVLRVIERGWMDDFYAILNLYGLDDVRQTIKNLHKLNDIDIKFVSIAFEIPLNELKSFQLSPNFF